MRGEIQPEQWHTYLDEFSKRNVGRMAGLEVISEKMGTQQEADLLRFEGITLETKGSLATSVEIMLGTGGAVDNRNLTHTITQVLRIVPKTGADGREDALEIEAADGAKTILIFKALAELTATAS